MPRPTPAPRPSARASVGDWTAGARTGHPNDIRPAELPVGGDPARYLFEVPEDVVVLGRGTWIVRLLRSNDAELAAALGRAKSKYRAAAELRPDSEHTEVYLGEHHLGRLPRKAEERVGAVVREQAAVGRRVLTWARISPPEMSVADGAARSGSALCAEVDLPHEGQPTFADAYDASFAFPHAKVIAAAADKPIVDAARAGQVADAGPGHQNITLRIGSLSVKAARVPWRTFGDGSHESRGLRFPGERGIWVAPDDVSDEMARAGARIVEVAGLAHHPDHGSPAFSAESPVRLVPEPGIPYDRSAIAVRSADGRLLAGYIAAAEAARLARTGGPQHAIVAWEHRTTWAEGDREGLRLLVTPEPISIEG